MLNASLSMCSKYSLRKSPLSLHSSVFLCLSAKNLNAFLIQYLVISSLVFFSFLNFLTSTSNTYPSYLSSATHLDFSDKSLSSLLSTCLTSKLITRLNYKIFYLIFCEVSQSSSLRMLASSSSSSICL